MTNHTVGIIADSGGAPAPQPSVGFYADSGGDHADRAAHHYSGVLHVGADRPEAS